MSLQEQQIPSPQATMPLMHDEDILVVPTATLFPSGSWNGLRPINWASYQELIDNNKEFLPRSRMEQDPTYKQIIPYLIFTYNDTYFMMQRRAQASEQRLQSKMSLGIGGHIRAEDLTHNDMSLWARREFEEEVAYTGSYTIEPIGLLNDDSNEVGKVHAGLVFLLHGDSADITIRSEHKSGVLVDLATCCEQYHLMETWSQIVIDFLKTR